MSEPIVSVVVPIYNRGPDILRHPLASVRAAGERVPLELIVVDDGSEPPAQEVLDALGVRPDRLVRQVNRGLLFARLAGLEVARGKYVQFLDSDDLITPEKLPLQVEALERTGAALAYSDVGRASLDATEPLANSQADAPLRLVADTCEFGLTVQPAPHSPLARREYWQSLATRPLVAPSPLFNPVAEIWFYHLMAFAPAPAVHTPGAHAIIGTHGSERLTGHWEHLGLASLAVMQAFASAAPRSPEHHRARQLIGENAFRAWRRLPRGVPREFERRMLAVWRASPRGDSAALGGPLFVFLARMLGQARAGALLRLRNARYAGALRTISDATWAARLSESK